MQWFCQNNPETGERRARPFSTNMVGQNGVDIAVLYLDWVGTHWQGHTWPGKANELVWHFNPLLKSSSSTCKLIPSQCSANAKWFLCQDPTERLASFFAERECAGGSLSGPILTVCAAIGHPASC